MFPSILTFDFVFIVESFWLFGGPNGLFFGQGNFQKLFPGLLIKLTNFYFLCFLHLQLLFLFQVHNVPRTPPWQEKLINQSLGGIWRLLWGGINHCCRGRQIQRQGKQGGKVFYFCTNFTMITSPRLMWNSVTSL